MKQRLKNALMREAQRLRRLYACPDEHTKILVRISSQNFGNNRLTFEDHYDISCAECKKKHLDVVE